MPRNLTATATIGALYLLFFVVGMRVGRRTRGTAGAEVLLLADRRLPILLATLTLVATWVDGGYINGTAEAIYDPSRGLLWAQGPWCFALSLILGGLCFAGRMRRYRFTTMLDLFECRYGGRVTAVLYVPALLGDLCWSAAILAALGATCAAIFGIDARVAIVVSVAIAVAYTISGGLWSVAYTDALQLACVAGGLCAAVPFALDHVGGLLAAVDAYRISHAGSARLVPPVGAWYGSQPWAWQWADYALQLVLGGIPWQVYFQRVLACPDEKSSVRLSVLAGLVCLLMAVPPALLGLAGTQADWASVGAAPPATPADVLPHVLRYLTPTAISILGLAAVAAAVMSSVDSALLSSATMFSWNVYRPLARGKKSESELRLVTRVALLAVAALAAYCAVWTDSVYTFWTLSVDLVYVILFPQLVAALYDRRVNSVGAVAGAATALTLRLMGGEPLLGLEPWVRFPFTVPELGVLFPFRTTAMLAGLLTIWSVSRLTGHWNAPRPLPNTP